MAGRTWGRYHGVQPGRGGTQCPQPPRRRRGGNPAAACKHRRQKDGPPGRLPVQVDREQPRSRQLVLLGERQRRRLSGHLLAAVRVADSQDRLARPAATVDAKPPRARARP
jgi:hypothetical protein